MIEVKDLEIKYDDFIALDTINITVEKNTTCAVIGPSGCGKSTLLYGLAGLLKPSMGRIEISGQEVLGNRRETGLILQNYGLLPWKTVWENIALGLKIRRTDRGIIEGKVNELLRELNLESLKNQYPVQLSGGQRQRVAIARALSIEPDLLLMDEPFSSLDALSRESLQNLLLKIYKDRPLTSIIVTHNIEEAVFLGQKIIVMEKERGHIKHVMDNPYFGDENFRYKMDFYQICMEVRKLMEKDA